MFGFFIGLHLLVCLGLVFVVLVQSGKGGGLAGGAFGGSAQTVLGGRGATDFITRATMILGAAFFITSMALAMISTGGNRAPRSLLQTEARRQQSQAPANAGQAPARPAAGTAAPAPSTGTPSSGAPAGSAPSTPPPATGGK